MHEQDVVAPGQDPGQDPGPDPGPDPGQDQDLVLLCRLKVENVEHGVVKEFF